jgi:hypothetical protein
MAACWRQRRSTDKEGATSDAVEEDKVDRRA